MILYVDPILKEISSSNIGNVPIKITTDINLFKLIKINDTIRKYDMGAKVYLNVNGTQTYDNKSYVKLDKITELNKKQDIELDEDFYNCMEIPNKDILQDVYKFEQVNICDENCKDFDLTEILNKEYLNILNNSDYDYIITDILGDIDVSSSLFRNYNNMRVNLNTNDHITMYVTLDAPISSFRLVNIDSKLTVFVNNIKCTNTDNISDCILVDSTSNIKIDILNETTQSSYIVNPYLLVK